MIEHFLRWALSAVLIAQVAETEKELYKEWGRKDSTLDEDINCKPRDHLTRKTDDKKNKRQWINGYYTHRK